MSSEATPTRLLVRTVFVTAVGLAVAAAAFPSAAAAVVPNAARHVVIEASEDRGIDAPLPLALGPAATVLRPTRNTYVYQRALNAKYNTSTRLLAGRDRLGYIYWSLLRFDPAQITGVNYPYIHEARLRLWLVSGGTGWMVTGYAAGSWYDNSTWLTKPPVVWLPNGRRSVSGTNRWVEQPVTDVVQQWMVSGVFPQNGFVVSGQYPGAVWTFASSREPYALHRPRLDVWSSGSYGMSQVSRESTVIADASQVVTVAVTGDLGGPWADTDITLLELDPNGNGGADPLGRFAWMRDRPGAGWDATAAPGGGWFAVSREAGTNPQYVVPRFEQWTMSVSPDKHRRTVSFAWSVSRDYPPQGVYVYGFGMARPPGYSVLRSLGPVFSGDFANPTSVFQVVAPPSP